MSVFPRIRPRSKDLRSLLRERFPGATSKDTGKQDRQRIEIQEEYIIRGSPSLNLIPREALHPNITPWSLPSSKQRGWVFICPYQSLAKECCDDTGKAKTPTCFQFWLSYFIDQRESSEGLANEPFPAKHSEARGWVPTLTKWMDPRKAEQAPIVPTKFQCLPQSLHKGQAIPQNYKTLCSLQRVVFSFISYCN